MHNLVIDDKKRKYLSIFYQNFLVYYFISLIFTYFFINQYGNDYNTAGYVIFCLFIYSFIAFTKPLFDEKFLKLEKGSLYFSIALNFIFWAIVLYLMISLNNLHNIGSSYVEYFQPVILFYIIAFWLIIIFTFRNYEIVFLKKSKQLTLDSFELTKKFLLASKLTIFSGLRTTLIFPVLLDSYSVRKLRKNYRAVYFAKKFIIIQSNSMKNLLPGTRPETISNSVKMLFESDIDRMYQLLKGALVANNCTASMSPQK